VYCAHETKPSFKQSLEVFEFEKIVPKPKLQGLNFKDPFFQMSKPARRDFFFLMSKL
jgi:hypothetical protein